MATQMKVWVDDCGNFHSTKAEAEAADAKGPERLLRAKLRAYIGKYFEGGTYDDVVEFMMSMRSELRILFCEEHEAYMKKINGR